MEEKFTRNREEGEKILAGLMALKSYLRIISLPNM